MIPSKVELFYQIEPIMFVPQILLRKQELYKSGELEGPSVQVASLCKQSK